MTWLSDTLLGLYNEVEPIALVSPFEATEQSLPSIGTQMRANFYKNRAHLSPDGQAVVFLARELYSEPRWYLWNFHDAPRPVFPWIPGPEGKPVSAEWSEIVWLSNGMTTITPKPYGVDVAAGIPMEAVEGDNLKLRQVAMPDPALETSPLGTTSDANWIALRQYDLLAPANLPDAVYFYSVEQDILVDYCLDLAEAEMPPFFSASREHIALTLRSDPGPAATYRSLILELASGRRAVVRDMEVLAWGYLP